MVADGAPSVLDGAGFGGAQDGRGMEAAWTRRMNLERRNRARAVSISVVALVLVVLGGYWFLVVGPGQRLVSPPGSDIVQFSGESDQTTSEFTVRGQWQVHWENQGDEFSFAITGDKDLGTIVDQTEPGSGVTNVVAAGTFNLQVHASGPWTIQITQGE
jgi:hypothetical protein